MKVLINILAHFFAVNARIDENTPARVSAGISYLTSLPLMTTTFVILDLIDIKFKVAGALIVVFGLLIHNYNYNYIYKFIIGNIEKIKFKSTQINRIRAVLVFILFDLLMIFIFIAGLRSMFSYTDGWFTLPHL